MADTDDQEFDNAFDGFGDDPAQVTPPVTDPPATPPPAAAEPPKVDPPKPAEEPKKDEEPAAPPADPDKKEETPPPADPEKKPEDPAKPPETPETPPAPPEEPKPLTKDDVTSIIRDLRTEERTTGQALEETTKDVLDAYYPDGLSNVLVDQASGKELKTPQDVVDASGGQMPIEEAAQWLMNEQYKLDQDVNKIRSDAKQIAETTLKFKQDGIDVLQRYDPVFKVYPHLQQKVWDQYKKLVKADEAKGVVLSAPDMRDFYDTVLEPYRLAVEYQTGQAGTAPVAADTPPAPPKPGADDRLDEGGDGGGTPPNDPNDFAQQVSKELAKGI